MLLLSSNLAGFSRPLFDKGKKKIGIMFYDQIARIVVFQCIKGMRVCGNNLFKRAGFKCFDILFY